MLLLAFVIAAQAPAFRHAPTAEFETVAIEGFTGVDALSTDDAGDVDVAFS